MTLISTLIKVTIVPDSHNFPDIPLIVDEHFHQLLSRTQLCRLPTDSFTLWHNSLIILILSFLIT